MNRKINEVFKKIAVLGATIAFAFTATSCSNTDSANTQTSSQEQKVSNNTVIGLTYIPNIQFAPFYVAQDKKFLDSNVSLRHHGANEGLFDALISGSENFVIAGGAEAIKAMDGNELDLVVVSEYYKKYPVSIFALKEKNINTPSDLKGKTIGIPGKYGENYFALLFFMKENDLTEQDVVIKEIGYTQLAAMKTGQVDAVVGYTNNDLINLEENNIQVSTIEVTNGDNPMLSASLITTRKYLEENPTVVETVRKAMLNAMKFSVENPKETVDITANTYVKELKDEKNKIIALKVLEATNKLFDINNKNTEKNSVDIDKCEKTQRFMYESKIISKLPEKNICKM